MAVAYDPKLASVIADPYPVFRQLREEEPLHRSQVLGGVVLTRYADVKACLIEMCVSNRHLMPRAILSGHATTGKPRGAGATATARD